MHSSSNFRIVLSGNEDIAVVILDFKIHTCDGNDDETLLGSHFRPGNGSPSTTNVVVVLVVIISTKAFSIHNRS